MGPLVARASRWTTALATTPRGSARMTMPKMSPPCFAFLQSELVQASGGKAIVLFRPTEQMENPYGIIQGGILAAMLDNTIGPALWRIVPDQRSSTIHMPLNFLRPLQSQHLPLGV